MHNEGYLILIFTVNKSKKTLEKLSYWQLRIYRTVALLDYTSPVKYLLQAKQLEKFQNFRKQKLQ